MDRSNAGEPDVAMGTYVALINAIRSSEGSDDEGALAGWEFFRTAIALVVVEELRDSEFLLALSEQVAVVAARVEDLNRSVGDVLESSEAARSLARTVVLQPPRDRPQ